MTAVTSIKVSAQVDMYNAMQWQREPVQQWRLTAKAAVQADYIGALSRWAHLQLLKRFAID